MRFYQLMAILIILDVSFSESFGSQPLENKILKDCEHCTSNNFNDYTHFNSRELEEILEKHDKIIQTKLEYFNRMSSDPQTSNLYNNPFYSQSFELENSLSWYPTHYYQGNHFGNWTNFPESFQVRPMLYSDFDSESSITNQPQKGFLENGSQSHQPTILEIETGSFGAQSEFYNFGE
jgi:hypothetical protein